MLTPERIKLVEGRERTYGSRNPRDPGCPPRFALAKGPDPSSESPDPAFQADAAARNQEFLDASGKD